VNIHTLYETAIAKSAQKGFNVLFNNKKYLEQQPSLTLSVACDELLCSE
jgi:hypothetical protein